MISERAPGIVGRDSAHTHRTRSASGMVRGMGCPPGFGTFRDMGEEGARAGR
jgi:hypothetical protein